MNLSRHNRRGSLVLVALCFTAVLGIALASYIAVCYHSLTLSTRESIRQQTRRAAEMGIERALWALNNATWSGYGTWTASGTTETQSITGYDVGQGASCDISITVTGVGTSTPTITSVATTTLPKGGTLVRTLTATTQKASLFTNALSGVAPSNASATRAITFSGGGLVDSYDSTLGNYNLATNRTSKAVVSVLGRNLQIQNATIYGYLAYPSPATMTYVAGSTNPAQLCDAAASTWDYSRVNTNPFQVLPSISSVPASVYNGDLSNANHTVGSVGATTIYHQTTNLTLNPNQTLTIIGTVVMDVAGNLTLNSSSFGGKSFVHINSNSSLELHVSGTMTLGNTASNTDIGGGIDNSTTKDPRKLVIYNTADNTSSGQSTIYTTTPFYGVIYMPKGRLTIASQPFTLYGSLVTYRMSFSYNGTTATLIPQIHYDTSLRAVTFPNVSTIFLVQLITES